MLVELSLSLFGDKQHFGGKQVIKKSSAGSPLFIKMLRRKQRDTWLCDEKNFAYTALIGVAKWHLYKSNWDLFSTTLKSLTYVSLFIIASLMNWLNTSLLRILMIGRKAIHWIISRCQYSDDSCSASIIVAAYPHVIHIGKIFRLTTTTSIWQTVRRIICTIMCFDTICIARLQRTNSVYLYSSSHL